MSSDNTQTKSKNKIQHTPLESALFQITEWAVNTASIKDYAARLHLIIGQLMYAENIFVVMYEQNKSILDFLYIRDESDSEIDVNIVDKLSIEDLRRTVTGYMLSTGKMQHLSASDIQDLIDNNIVEDLGAPSNDWLGVPLVYNQEILGGIVVQSYQDKIKYDLKDEALLQFVARQIALVFKSKQSEMALIYSKAELENYVTSRTKELNKINLALEIEVAERKKSEEIQFALFKIAELVNESDSLVDFYTKVHLVIKSLMSAENEYVAILSDDMIDIEFPYFVDQNDPSPKKRPLDLTKKKLGMTERIFKTGEAILYNRKKGDPVSSVGSNCVSFLGVPLKNSTSTFGVLAVQSYQKDIVYTKKNKHALQTIGQQVATAILRKKDSDSLVLAHENLEYRVKERTIELEQTIENRRKVEEKLAHDSLHDSLTGLPNRFHLAKALNSVIGKEKKNDNSMIALLFLDLDRFKLINDSLGHHIGDLFLIEVAKRLKECTRSHDMVARLGGDEFCILMPDIPKEIVALELCSRILKELKIPVEVEKNSLMTSASIGVRLAKHSEKSAALIMSDADAAMYQAKNQGKNRFCFFDAEIKKLVTSRMKLERDLRAAMENDELFLEYQPIINIVTNQVVGFEALVRWRHPKKGLISPVEFIPVAEETGLIVGIGELVVRMAFDILKLFKKDKSLSNLYINVNVSSVQILSRTLDDYIRTLITKLKINPDKFNVEITESILIDDYTTALNFVRELKAMGIKIYLDDFGTGFSSLSYLHKFPFDAIKLDRSFIQVLDLSRNNQAIVESIAHLAKNLNIEIVAEGIETKKQLEMLKDMDYRLAQGFYFSKAIGREKIADYILASSLEKQ